MENSRVQTSDAMAAVASPAVIIIETATRRKPTLRLRDLWEYRELLYCLLAGDQIPYKQNMLVPTLVVIHPLIMVALFGKLVSILCRNSLPI